MARHGGPIQALDTSTAFQSMFVLCHVMDGRIASRPLRRSPLRIVASGSESTMRLLDFSDWCKKVLWAPLRMTELYAAQIASRGKTVPPSVRARRAVMEAAAAAAGGDRQHVRDALLKAAEGCEQTQKLLNACPDSTFEFEMFGCWYAHCTNLTGCSEALLKMKKCSGCQAAAYCCVECQRADWARHKQHCSSRSARNQAAAGVAADAAALGTAAAPTDGIAAISL